MIEIQDIMRAGHVMRWNTVNITRQQTLAEHMYNVTMIATVLCTRLELYTEIPSVMQWALIHDVPEVACGDTPTPTKRRMKEAGFDMESIYDKIDPDYAAIKNITGAEVKWIVKVADLIEGYWFIREHGIGDHAKNIADNLYKQIYKMVDTDIAIAIDAGNVAIKLMNDVVGGAIHE